MRLSVERVWFDGREEVLVVCTYILQALMSEIGNEKMLSMKGGGTLTAMSWNGPKE